jgi:hypothetical protein
MHWYGGEPSSEDVAEMTVSSTEGRA